MARSEIKKISKTLLKNNFGSYLLVSLIYSLIVFIGSFLPFIGGFITLLLIPILNYAIINITMVARTNGKFEGLTKTLDGFNSDYFVINIGMQLIKSIIIFLVTIIIGAMLFASLFQGNLFVPIILAIATSIGIATLDYFIFLIPYESYKEAKLGNFDQYIRNSFKLMKGHKLELFVQHLSFFGWSMLVGIIGSYTIQLNFVLGAIVMGILSLILALYISVADAVFAQNLLGFDNREKAIEVEVAANEI